MLVFLGSRDGDSSTRCCQPAVRREARIPVPEHMMGTVAASLLADRFANGKWTLWTKGDSDGKRWDGPAPQWGLRQASRVLNKRGKEPVCLTAHYCCVECQKVGWARHRRDCKNHASKLQHTFGLAMPDYEIFCGIFCNHRESASHPQLCFFAVVTSYFSLRIY